MKAGWTTKPLGELCNVIGGGTPPKDRPDYYGGDIPWATVRDMRTDIITSTEHSITSEAVKASATNIIPAGNVVIATRVGLGKVCLLAQDTAVNQDLRGIVPKSNKEIDVAFLFAWFKSISAQIIAEGTGATVQGVKLPFIKGLSVPVPAMEEQRRIVTLLDEAFADIATAKANAEKNLQNVTSIFENHLQVIFSNDESSRERKTLGSEFATVTGTTPPKSNASFYGAFIPLVKPPELLDDVIESAPDSLTESGAKAARVLPAFSVLVSCIGNLGKIGINTAPVCFNQQINAILPNQAKALPDFMFFQALSPVFKKQLEGLASGTTVPIVNKSKFNSIQIVLPPLEQQANIVEQLKALREETQSLESIYRQKLTTLDDLKKSLLHQAFSGQL